MRSARRQQLRDALQELSDVANALERYQPLTDSLETAVHKLVNALQAAEAENERLREVIQGLRQRQRSDLDERDATNPACPTIDAARKPHDVRTRLGE